MSTPIRPTDDDARELAWALLNEARTAALGVLHKGSVPMVTRIAFGLTPEGAPLSLISELAEHTRALRQHPECSLLVGEPGVRGDPLNHPRLTVQAKAEFVPHGTPEHEKLAAHYLRGHPKAKLYIGFADFHFVRFNATRAFLNGGFGKAYELRPTDLQPAN